MPFYRISEYSECQREKRMRYKHMREKLKIVKRILRLQFRMKVRFMTKSMIIIRAKNRRIDFSAIIVRIRENRFNCSFRRYLLIFVCRSLHIFLPYLIVNFVVFQMLLLY